MLEFTHEWSAIYLEEIKHHAFPKSTPRFNSCFESIQEYELIPSSFYSQIPEITLFSAQIFTADA